MRSPSAACAARTASLGSVPVAMSRLARKVRHGQPAASEPVWVLLPVLVWVAVGAANGVALVLSRTARGA